MIRFNGGPFDGLDCPEFDPRTCPETFMAPINEATMRLLMGELLDVVADRKIIERHPNQAAVYELRPTENLGEYFFTELISMDEFRQRFRAAFGYDPEQHQAMRRRGGPQ